MELLNKSLLLVCILMAGADGRIEDRELDKAVEMARQREGVRSVLDGFFQGVAKDFEDKLKVLIQSYPVSKERRNKLIIEELKRLNPLWAKLEPKFGIAYYEMLRHYARSVASSSGRFWAPINEEEAALVDLPMLEDPSKK